MHGDKTELLMKDIAGVIKQTKAYYCLDCGKCTGNCPVSLFDPSFSPRIMVKTVLSGDGQKLSQSRLLWSCLGCQMCEQRCPSDVRYIDFQRGVRSLYRDLGHRQYCSHGGAFQSLMKIMTASRLRQNRLGWVTGDLEISRRSQVAYFVGCLPYFDIFFSDLDVHTLDIARAAVRILNALGIRPGLLEDERCCGHDLLWTGDEEAFVDLARHNVRQIESSKAKKVVFSCPEGYRTFRLDYPRYLGKLSFEVVYLGELLENQVLSLERMDGTITFQDPCRLGRHMGMYELPRQMLGAIAGLRLVEMRHNRHTAICCGTSAWTDCSGASKQIQMMRLQEAKQTGAQTLVTACPKCQIHLTCAMKDKHLGGSLDIDISDLITMVAACLK